MDVGKPWLGIAENGLDCVALVFQQAGAAIQAHSMRERISLISSEREEAAGIGGRFGLAFGGNGSAGGRGRGFRHGVAPSEGF